MLGHCESHAGTGRLGQFEKVGLGKVCWGGSHCGRQFSCLYRWNHSIIEFREANQLEGYLIDTGDWSEQAENKKHMLGHLFGCKYHKRFSAGKFCAEGEKV